ncbi:MAG: 5-(carboxyamino)imidazole ribonucleotide synthase [Haliscomenobacter sp.]|nr:5-(carboxyamino)imidazole ribonucleotide synthase [Haliscomenobacter sp.]
MINNKEITTCNLGILGGGQLGKMLALAAGNWHLPVHILDESADYPAGPFAASFTAGYFNRYEDVYAFGKTVDLLTIEIEHVHTGALKQLQAEGFTIHPDPSILEIIKDKGLQKKFYHDRGIPTAPFQLFDSEQSILDALGAGTLAFPFVQKTRTAGYDGRGVSIIRREEDLKKLLPGASVIEALAPIEKELAVIVARNERGEIAAYPTVEMDFNPEANLVEFLVCPSRIDPGTEQRAVALAIEVMKAYGLCGLLAVELFLTGTGDLLVNEVAPRTHNSGHHTLDSCETSQFEQHLRAILNLPLGSTRLHTPAVMVNLLGAEGFQGPVHYQGLEECLALPGVHLHLYGKAITKPYRKMGHATVVHPDIAQAAALARSVQQTLRIESR